jgi:hypothetical protein
MQGLNDVQYIAFMAVIGKLSCQLQKQYILFSEIQPLMDAALAQLDHFKDHDGECLTDMQSIMNSLNCIS